MFRSIVLFFLFVLVSSSGFFVFAEDAQDMASSSFMVKTGCMDPMHPADCDGSSAPHAISGRVAFEFILEKVSMILLRIVPIIAGISFMVAGYYYVLSAGDTEKVNQAKTIIKWNIVAILVAFLSLTMVTIVQYIIS